MTPALNLIRTTTFRLTVIYAGLFGASAITILIFLYWASIGFMERQTDETLMAELQGLEEQYRQRGLAGVNRLIVSRSARGDENLYLLLAPSGRMISGNLNAPPKGAYSSEGWIDFNYNRPVYDELGRPAGTAARAARARRVAVQGQYTLIVGRDIDDLRRIERAMKTALAWAAALTLILGLGGGVILSRNMLRRLDQVNQTSRRIMAGDLSHRIAVSGTGDELDQLAGNLNAMLDQIEQLMNGLKEVGDNIAHDLRSPLTRLRNRLDVTLMGESDEAGLRDALRKTIDDADGLLETLNALLNIARIESGSQRDSLKPLDLGDLAQDLVDLYTPVAQDAGYELLSEISDDLFIKGAKQLISQALSNLVDNALKYGGGGRCDDCGAWGGRANRSAGQ